MDIKLAIISELISSIALVGVVITLLLESRQLRTSQISASLTLQSELIKLAMDHPDITSILGLQISSDDYPKYAFLGLLLESWEVGYSLETMPDKAVQGQARSLFRSDYARTWWAVVRKTWSEAAATKSEKKFFALIDGEFAAANVREPGIDPVDETDETGSDQ